MSHWTTKEGKEIEYTKLEDSHLLNILAYIQNRSEEGIKMMYGGSGFDIDDCDYHEETIYGKEVLDEYDYDGLLKERKRRGI